ncbi:MAG: hypothetical protein IPM35_41510 [Myxococcales bacterium]|nr:hypothetical protein [Myxococcales bacterium]
MDNRGVDEDASRLTELLEGRLDEADAEALETRLERRAARRRMLAAQSTGSERVDPRERHAQHQGVHFVRAFVGVDALQ